jgi:hypothetical protein
MFHVVLAIKSCCWCKYAFMTFISECSAILDVLQFERIEKKCIKFQCETLRSGIKTTSFIKVSNLRYTLPERSFMNFELLLDNKMIRGCSNRNNWGSRNKRSERHGVGVETY